jgi:hypothetical protein
MVAWGTEQRSREGRAFNRAIATCTSARFHSHRLTRANSLASSRRIASAWPLNPNSEIVSSNTRIKPPQISGLRLSNSEAVTPRCSEGCLSLRFGWTRKASVGARSYASSVQLPAPGFQDLPETVSRVESCVSYRKQRAAYRSTRDASHRKVASFCTQFFGRRKLYRHERIHGVLHRQVRNSAPRSPGIPGSGKELRFRHPVCARRRNTPHESPVTSAGTCSQPLRTVEFSPHSGAIN